MHDIEMPEKALSIRQPWAWAIMNAGKDIENRSWTLRNPGIHFRGPVCIHASKGMTKAEHADAAAFMTSIDIRCPEAEDLLRGGIIGTAEIVDIVEYHPSPWFFGPFGLVLADPKPIDFFRVKGALGFFGWAPDLSPAPQRDQRDLFQ